MVDNRYPWFTYLDCSPLSYCDYAGVKEVLRRVPAVRAIWCYKRDKILFTAENDCGIILTTTRLCRRGEEDSIVNTLWRQLNQSRIEKDRLIAASQRADEDERKRKEKQVSDSAASEAKSKMAYDTNKLKHGKHSRNTALIQGTKK